MYTSRQADATVDPSPGAADRRRRRDHVRAATVRETFDATRMARACEWRNQIVYDV